MGSHAAPRFATRPNPLPALAANFAALMRLLLLVNESASSVTPRSRVVIQKALSADHDVTVAETSRRGHATRLAQGAAADDVEAVIVPGGDGPLNEAANGLGGSRGRIGLGSVNGRYFLFNVGVGFDAAVVAQVEKRGALKRYAGHPLFVY